MRMKVRIEGTDAIARKLNAMGKVLTRKTLEPILAKNLQPIADDMRASAPRDKGELAASVRVSKRLSKTQRAKLEPIARVEMYVGPGPLPQAVQEEFGNDHQAPHPFIRPAFDRGADRAVRGIAEQGIAAILDAGRKG
jgi:HK97 gp10 family phage protein